jgi:membrane protein DedA with SNARE-associated domain
VQHLIVTYGYFAIFLLMVAESACIPIPSELTMLCGGAAAGGAVAGAHLNLVGVIIAGVVGNVVGSYIAYAVGRYAGQPAWHRWGRAIRLRDGDLVRAERWFDKHGSASVFFARLLPVIRTFISLPAGVAEMNPVRFGIYTSAGVIPWTAGLAIAGYEIGSNWHTVADDFKGPTYIIAAVVVVAVVAALVLHFRRSRPETTATAAGTTDRTAARTADDAAPKHARHASAQAEWPTASDPE